MAVNKNNALDNGHCAVVGMSGCGKTSLVKKKIIKVTDQVAIFDPFGDYDGKLCGRVVRGYESIKDFAAALIAGRKTNQGFKIAWQPERETTVEDFDTFCKIIWTVADGSHSKPLKVILEEVAAHSSTAGAAKGYHKNILNIGRKFGIHSVNIFQRGQEVSKTIIDGCQHMFVMMQKSNKSAAYLEQQTGIDAAAIMSLKKLDYIHQDGKAYTKSKIRW